MSDQRFHSGETVVIEIPSREVGRGKQVPEEVKDAIVGLRLQGESFQNISDRLDVGMPTVKKHWRKYLEQASKERVENTSTQLQEVIERYQQNSLDARAGFYQTIQDAPSTAQKFLIAEQTALERLSKLGVVRDDEPHQQARIQAAQAVVLATVVRDVIHAANLTNEERSALLMAFSAKLKEVSDVPEPVVLDLDEEDEDAF
jgi:transposase-like protein